MPLKLEIVHIPKEFQGFTEVEQIQTELESGKWVAWNTCLRSLYFRVRESAQSPANLSFPKSRNYAQYFEGVPAYAFLLEIVSGLHSPILGETEVLGQYKEFLRNLSGRRNRLRSHLQRLSQSLFQDAKLVRSSVINGLGPRTYGSVVRSFAPKTKEAWIIGAGQLAREIAPWISQQDQSLSVFCRNVEKAQSGFENVVYKGERSIHSLEDLRSEILAPPDLVIIAAPIDNHTIQGLLTKHSANIPLLIDLREGSEPKALQTGIGRIIGLEEFFTKFSRADTKAAEIKTKATNFIRKRAQHRGERVEHRPFGWDDLCA